MKLGEGGEAFFVFETEGSVPKHLVTSPVVSPTNSPPSSPQSSSSTLLTQDEGLLSDNEPDFLDLENAQNAQNKQSKQKQQQSTSSFPNDGMRPRSSTLTRDQVLERAQQLTKKLKTVNIRSKVTDNGDVVMDMTGYKSGKAEAQESDEVVRRILEQEFGETNLDDLMKRDPEGHLRIFPSLYDKNGLLDYGDQDSGSDDDNSNNNGEGSATTPPDSPNGFGSHTENKHVYAKTLRLTSEQLKSLKLNPGCNNVSFTVLQSKAQCTARMFYWKSNVPIVISDIDGTITKSDALGHVLAMIGRDWTHPGVGKLFTDIQNNGYHVMYLTARSVGQADSTRSYLKGISQEGYKLPDGPVILSPDRTMAALKREVVLKKPEVFKMACLNDIQNLYADIEGTPFYAGFGNRITDGLSYRSVGIPSSRIFTINPNGEVHLELLELSGYKSSYVSISDLVDHFFPLAGYVRGQESYTDLTYWKDPILDLSDLSDLSDAGVTSGDNKGNGDTKPDNARFTGNTNMNNASPISIPRSHNQRPTSKNFDASPTFSSFGGRSPQFSAIDSSTDLQAMGLKLAYPAFPSSDNDMNNGNTGLLPEAEISNSGEPSYKDYSSSASENDLSDDESVDDNSSNEYEEEYEDEDEGYEEDYEDEESEIGHGEYDSDIYEYEEDKESQIGHGEYGYEEEEEEREYTDDQDDYSSEVFEEEEEEVTEENGSLNKSQKGLVTKQPV